MLTVLDIINEMLALQGELPVNDINSTHPSVPGALLFLNNRNVQIQAERWWFNTEHDVTLTPQIGTGFIRLPNNTLSFDSYQRHPNYTLRGNKLYNSDKQTFVFDAPIKGVLHRLVPLDELPMLALAYVGAVARMAFQNTYDADVNKTRLLAEEKQMAEAAFKSEHTRQLKTNMFNNPYIARQMVDIYGDRQLPGRLFSNRRGNI